MVNDLLKELYLFIMVPHMVRLLVGILTSDKYPLSEVSHLRGSVGISALVHANDLRGPEQSLRIETAQYRAPLGMAQHSN
jgi:hypothetical protein